MCRKLEELSMYYWVAEAVKAFGGDRRTLEMLDAFRYEISRNA
jgi:hypothetical protein